MPENQEITGTDIKKKIKDADYTIEQVARTLGIKGQSLHSRLDAQDLGINFLNEIARAINKPLGYLIGGTAPANMLNEPDGPAYGQSTAELLQKLVKCGDTVTSLQQQVIALQQEKISWMKKHNQSPKNE